MALKQVKDYYKGIEKLYFELVSDLREMENEFKSGSITQEELDKLMVPVQNIKDNYLRLSYIMHLFYQPNRKKKVPTYEKQEHTLVKAFEDNRVDKDSDLEDSRYALNEFKKHLEDFKKEKKNDSR